MVQEAATEQLAIEEADSKQQVSAVPTQTAVGPGGLTLVSSAFLPDGVLWSALRAKAELERRGEPLLGPASTQLSLSQQVEAEAYLASAGAAREEPTVNHVQVLFIVGVALVTMQIDLNAAVVSFTLLFHLSRFAHTLGWTTHYLQDMRLAGPTEASKNKRNKQEQRAQTSIDVGDWVCLKGSSSGDAAAVGIVKSLDFSSGRYTVLRQPLPSSASSEDSMKTQLLDDSQEAAGDSAAIDSSPGAASGDASNDLFMARVEELVRLELGGAGSDARRAASGGKSGLSEPLLGDVDEEEDEEDEAFDVSSNCWIGALPPTHSLPAQSTRYGPLIRARRVPRIA